MNFLCHMLLSGNDDLILTGNFMGDFVKGPLEGRFHPRVRQGVVLHRRIDSYANRDRHFQASRQRLAPSFGLYRGVLVDLFYDHLLVRHWRQWSDEPFESFLSRTRRAIEAQHSELPPELQRLMPTIFDELLPSYGRIDGIAAALGRMSRRVSRPNPLAQGAGELERQYAGLLQDFNGFMPGLRTYCEDFISAVP